MITFRTTHNNHEYTFICELTDTILKLKENIINELQLDIKYIDIYYLVDKPIRGMGKFTIEHGLSPRTMDNNTFSNYNIDNKDIPISYVLVDDYIQPSSNSNKIINLHKYKQRNKVDTIDTNKNPTYNLTSELDFPLLN